jgi:hypothetical protein
MTFTEIKIYASSSIAMAFNFSNIDIGLKIALTVVVIGYTCQKWYLMNKNK